MALNGTLKWHKVEESLLFSPTVSQSHIVAAPAYIWLWLALRFSNCGDSLHFFYSQIHKIHSRLLRLWESIIWTVTTWFEYGWRCSSQTPFYCSQRPLHSLTWCACLPLIFSIPTQPPLHVCSSTLTIWRLPLLPMVRTWEEGFHLYRSPAIGDPHPHYNQNLASCQQLKRNAIRFYFHYRKWFLNVITGLFKFTVDTSIIRKGRLYILYWEGCMYVSMRAKWVPDHFSHLYN